MAIRELIITDVTCYGSRFCVAGWDAHAGVMVRPEPATMNINDEPSRFWTSVDAGPGKFFAVGNVVSLDLALVPPGSAFPHATEDYLFVPGTAKLVKTLALNDMVHAVAGSISKSMNAAFGGALVRANSGKAYVPAHHVGPSLGALEIMPAQLNLYVDNFDPAKPKLRALVQDGNQSYDLTIPADATRTRWKANGLAALQNDVKGAKQIHLRVGLSRPFNVQPNACYSQINGLYIY